jgi:hypothetical protein
MSFGVGPFATTGLGIPIADVPSATRSDLHSSRKIDPETMTYVTSSTGGFDGMPDTAQRVLLLIAFGVKEPPLIDNRYQAVIEARIRKALEPLTSGPEPSISRVKITIGENGKQTTTKSVEYYDLRSGETNSVKAP